MRLLKAVDTDLLIVLKMFPKDFGKSAELVMSVTRIVSMPSLLRGLVSFVVEKPLAVVE